MLYTLTFPAKPTTLSGYCRIAYAELSELDGWPKVVKQMLDDSISLISGHTFSTMPVLENTLTFSDLPDEGPNGTRHKTILGARLPVAIAARDHLFRQMQELRWIVVGTDGNGQQRVIGTPEYPAKFSYTHDNSTGRNEYVMQWMAFTPFPALYVNGVEALPPPSGACDPATVNTNAVLFDTVPSGGTLNISITNSLAVLIGTVTPGVGVNVGNMTIDYPDGTTAAVVVVPGGTIVTAPRWSIQLAGIVASPVTVTAPAWDSSFVCSAQTPTGGTITQITVNGGAPVASLVGVAIPASAVLVLTFTGSLTQILLAF